MKFVGKLTAEVEQSYEDGKDPDVIRVRFTDVPKEANSFLAVLTGWELRFDDSDHHFTKAMVVLEQPDATTTTDDLGTTKHIDCTVQLKDTNGDDKYSAKVYVGLLCFTV